MKTAILSALTQPQLDTYLAARQYEQLYWPNFFPVKGVPSLDAKTIVGASGNRVAANIISYDAKTPELSRKSLSTKYFEIPKVAIAIRKTEREILEHYSIKAMLGMNAVLENYFADLDFCFDGVMGKMEWFALQAISAGTVTLSTTNNPLGIINEVAIDFGLPTANKEVASVTWATGGSTSKPITDLKAVREAARIAGTKLSYALMNQTTFDQLIACDEYTNAAKPMMGLDITTGILPVQSLNVVNRVLTALGSPQVVIIDQYVSIENAAGTRTSTNCWTSNHVTFLPEMNLGNFLAGPIAEEIEKPVDVIQSKRGPVLLSVKKDFNPVSILTKGEANVFPSWGNIDQCYILDTIHTSAGTWA